MRVSLIPIAFCVLLTWAGAQTYAACNGDCAEGSRLAESYPGVAARNSDRPAATREQPVVALDLRGEGAARKPGGGAAAGALVLRADNGGARPEIRPARMERNTLDPLAPVSKPSAWLLLLTGLAFVVTVVRKRGGG